MTKDIELLVYNRFNDRGSISSVNRLPSWSEMFRKGSFNALVLGALPQAANDTIARLWYMRTLSVYNSLFLLLPETVAVLERGSEHEDPYALFALGRYHLCTQKDPDSTARAVNCFEKAWASGLIEAAVALAMSYDSGDIGMVDRLKAKTLLETALKEDCEYAAKYQIHKMIYGVKGSRQALPEAMRICTSLIDKQKKDLGEDNVNPILHYYLGIAKRMSEGCTHGAEEIRTAAEAGLMMA